jgi:two-component system chemotaxis response regulator CheY
MSHSTTAEPSLPYVLLVEDDPTMRTMLRGPLAQVGCANIIQAANGLEALDFSKDRKLELVICDWQMDKMDGPTFLRALRERPNGADVPVIMVTSNTAEDSGDLAQTLRISSWLTKPISAARLVERIRAVLGARAPLADPAPGPRGEALLERYQAKLGADIASLQEVLATLPYRERDRPAAWLAIERTLHNIKGQAGTFDYALVTELARRGHDLLRRARAHPEPAARCHAEIARALGSVATAMQRVAANRLRGDGGEAGLRLLGKLDGFIDPLRATLDG